MGNVLFYAENFCGQRAKGGTEVATFRIARALKQTGSCKVFNAFRSRPSSDPEIYDGIIKLPKGQHKFIQSLALFIRENDIEVVVNMSRFFRHSAIVKAAQESGLNPKIFFMQHFAPGSEFKKTSFAAGRHLLKLNSLNPLYWLRASIYPLIKLPRNLRLNKIYRDTYNQSHRVILLSEGYKDDYCKVGRFLDKSKLVAIPNIFDPPKELLPNLKKEKRVLILSRLDEIQKRLSLALKIWSAIEKDADLADWHLDIVGTGHNTDIVKRLIKKFNLRNVTLHGWQNREPFLKRSSILMLTSEYEGLPLTLLEAQAFGCVPIAFNSFSSIKDVIEPFFNGVVVDNFADTNDFLFKLKDLMLDADYRNELAFNASKVSNKFTSQKIAQQWLKILTS